MKETLIRIKELREKREQQTEYYNSLLEKFNEENAEIVKGIQTTGALLIQAEEVVRGNALAIYNKTGEKKLDFGMGIREMTSLVYDEQNAFNWAKEHSLALALDKKAFEAIAKAQELDFVRVEKKVIATIPTKIEVE